jgi:hypothetical protein
LLYFFVIVGFEEDIDLPITFFGQTPTERMAKK